MKVKGWTNILKYTPLKTIEHLGVYSLTMTNILHVFNPSTKVIIRIIVVSRISISSKFDFSYFFFWYRFDKNPGFANYVPQWLKLGATIVGLLDAYFS